MIDDLRLPDTFDTRLGEWASANVTPYKFLEILTAGTKHRSQVIVLGCFSIGKKMTWDLCFVPAKIVMTGSLEISKF